MVTIQQGFILALALVMLPGCTLMEIRSKSKLGPEYRHKGSDRTNSVRWYAQQGFEFIWQDHNKNKITSGITYRRRDVDNGDGSNDNGVWFEFSFPIWKAKTVTENASRRIALLERRIASLESRQSQAQARSSRLAESVATGAFSD